MKFEEVLRQHRVPFRLPGQHHHVTGGWIGIDCAFCSRNSGRFRLGYNVRGGYFWCWSCGYHSAYDTLKELLDLPHAEMKSLLSGIEARQPAPLRPTGTYRQPDGVGPFAEPHLEYLKRRDFDPILLSRLWGVRGIGLTPRLAWRLFVPVTLRGVAVSWTTRAIIDSASPRWITARPEEESQPARKLIYGEDHALMAVCVVEGPADAWRIGPGAVATLGVGFSKAQVRKLLRFPVRYVCFDSDRAGRKRGKELCKVLSAYPGETSLIHLSSGKDAAEADGSEIWAIRKLINR